MHRLILATVGLALLVGCQSGSEVSHVTGAGYTGTPTDASWKRANHQALDPAEQRLVAGYDKELAETSARNKDAYAAAQARWAADHAAELKSQKETADAVAKRDGGRKLNPKDIAARHIRCRGGNS